MRGDRVSMAWEPIVDSTASQLVAESDEPFAVDVNYGSGDVEHVESLHDGLMHFVVVDVPVTARVEVKG